MSLIDEKARSVFNTPAYHINGFAHPNMLFIAQKAPSALVYGFRGLVPEIKKSMPEIKSYYKEAMRFGGGLNAQSEKLFNHSVYKNAAFTKRCVIPVTVFFFFFFFFLSLIMLTINRILFL